MRLSETTILCAANDTVMSSTDAGRSWSRYGGSPMLGSGYIPAPEWLKTKEKATMPALFMDIQPATAYVAGCFPDPGHSPTPRP